jgi:transposase
MGRGPARNCPVRRTATRSPGSVADAGADLHRQRQRRAHLTQQLLWEEYRQANPDGYRYSRFCELYQRWRRKQDVVLRQEHKAGEKLFVAWAGATTPIYDPRGGPVQQAHVFVAVLAQIYFTNQIGYGIGLSRQPNP